MELSINSGVNTPLLPLNAEKSFFFKEGLIFRIVLRNLEQYTLKLYCVPADCSKLSSIAEFNWYALYIFILAPLSFVKVEDGVVFWPRLQPATRGTFLLLYYSNFYPFPPITSYKLAINKFINSKQKYQTHVKAFFFVFFLLSFSFLGVINACWLLHWRGGLYISPLCFCPSPAKKFSIMYYAM